MKVVVQKPSESDSSKGFIPNQNDQITSFHKSTPVSEAGREPIKHLLIGSAKTVTSTIHHLQILGYARIDDWSPLLPSQNPGEVMSILTRYITVR